MSYVSKFKTNTAYSNADINEIIGAITGSGVLPSSPNDILSSVSNSGVTYADERCFVSWTDSDKTQIQIGSGTVIMPDGSYIVITDEALPTPQGDEAFVYIYQDLFLQNIPVCETALPDNENSYVLLAKIQDGEIIDKRKFAYSKIANYGARPILKTQLTVTISLDKVYPDTPFASIQVDNIYSNVIMYNVQSKYFGLFDLSEGLFKLTVSGPDGDLKTNRTMLQTKARLNDVSIRYIDGFLHFYSSEVLSSIISVNHTFNVIMF